MASYKERVGQDLDRWIAAGLVAPEQRKPILDSIAESRRVDAATALAWVGAVLLGAAAIAFVAANWDALPRLARFGLVLAVFAGAAGAGAWAARAGRPLLSNIALMVASLVFAAAIGLTGQIFDIVGSPQTMFYAAGGAAFALALAGRSTGAAAAALVLIGLGDLNSNDLFSRESAVPWMIGAAPLGAWLTLKWRAPPLAHLSALGLIYCFSWFAQHYHSSASLLLFFAILLAGFAAGARWLFKQESPFASVFYGWFTLGAFLFFIPAGYAALNESGFGSENFGLPHRVVWLALAGGVIALGRYDRHALVSTVGILALIGAIAALMMDLGLGLMTAAGVFLLCALAAIVGGLMLRRRVKAT